jgi:hypothetical protein
MALATMSQLSSLDLNFNLLTGSIGSSLCSGELATSLEYLFLRGNGLTGSVSLQSCKLLKIVDIQVRKRAR